MYCNQSSGGTTYTTSYQNANVTVANSTSQAIAIASDTPYKYNIRAKAQTTTKQWGDGQSAVCVDYVSTELSQSALAVVVNERAMGSGDVYPSDSIQGIRSGANSKAICYKIAPILGKSDTNVEIDFTSLSGENPSSDMVIHFITEGYYLSIDGKTMKWGVQKDDPSQTWVHPDQKVTFNFT